MLAFVAAHWQGIVTALLTVVSVALASALNTYPEGMAPRWLRVLADVWAVVPQPGKRGTFGRYNLPLVPSFGEREPDPLPPPPAPPRRDRDLLVFVGIACLVSTSACAPALRTATQTEGAMSVALLRAAGDWQHYDEQRLKRIEDQATSLEDGLAQLRAYQGGDQRRAIVAFDACLGALVSARLAIAAAKLKKPADVAGAMQKLIDAFVAYQAVLRDLRVPQTQMPPKTSWLTCEPAMVLS